MRFGLIWARGWFRRINLRSAWGLDFGNGGDCCSSMIWFWIKASLKTSFAGLMKKNLKAIIFAAKIFLELGLQMCRKWLSINKSSDFALYKNPSSNSPAFIVTESFFASTSFCCEFELIAIKLWSSKPKTALQMTF